MAKNYYITLEVHDEGKWPRIAPKDLMQHVDVRLPSGLTLASANVSENNSFDALKAAVNLFACVRDSGRADLDADEVPVLEFAIKTLKEAGNGR